MAKRRHKSARGANLDFDLMQHQNKDVIAVGNANMNANGDVLGRGGEIIRKAEDIPSVQMANPDAAYNQANPKSTKMVSLKNKVDPVDIGVPPKLENNIEEVFVESKSTKKNEPRDTVNTTAKEKPKTQRKIVDSEE